MKQFLFLIAGLFFACMVDAQEPTITMKTNKAIGDSIYLDLVPESDDYSEILIEGAEGEIASGRSGLVLTSQTITIKGKVTHLYCNNNELVFLDVSENLSLEVLDCQSNQLQDLKLSGCKELQHLFCANNQLEELNLSENTSLWLLECGQNKLSAIDISNNTALQVLSCPDNQLKAVDVSHNKGLDAIDCSNNELSSLDLSQVSPFQLFLYGNEFSACALDSIFTQLREGKNMNDLNQSPELRLSLAWLYCVFVKNGDVSLPGADGCREYIATDKYWKVLDYNNRDTLDINNAGRYVCDEFGTGISDIDVVFSVYPNPVQDNLYIQGSAGIKSLALYSLVGKLYKRVRIQEETNDYSLNLSEYPSGMYILQIETLNGVRSQKIIKK